MVSNNYDSDISRAVGQAAKRSEEAPFFLREGGKQAVVPLSDQLSWVD